MEEMNEIKEEKDEEKSELKITNVHSLSDTTSDDIIGVCDSEIEVKTEPQDFTRHLTLNSQNIKQEEKTCVVNDETSQDCQILDVWCENKKKKTDESSSTNDNKPVEEKRFICAVCQKQFKTRRKLNVHIRKSHGEKRHKCHLCEFRTRLRHSLVRHHKVVHQNQKPHKCPHCKYTAAIKQYIRMHVKAVHEKYKPFKCSACDKKFTQPSLRLRHYRVVHLREKPYKCEKCGFTAYNRIKSDHKCMANMKCDRCEYKTFSITELKSHVKSTHGELYKCTYCSRGFALQCNLTNHVSKVHVNLQTCEECGEKFSKLWELQHHSVALHDKRISVTADGYSRKVTDESCSTSDSNNNNRCPVCEMNFATFDNLKKHIQQEHVDVKQFCCIECQKWFKSKWSLDGHILALHGEKIHKCDLCSYSTQIRFRLDRHYSTMHLNQRPHKCPYCIYRSPTRSYLNSHIRKVHEHYRPFKCSLCNRTFTYKTDLNLHCRIVHMHEKPYRCEKCGFKSKYIRKTEHDCGKNIIKCDRCDFETVTVTELKSHIKSEHGELYKCTDCNFTFAKQSLVSKHIEKIHKEVHTCAECGKRFSNASKLENHCNVVQVKQTLFICKICDERFFILPDFKSHTKKHKK